MEKCSKAMGAISPGGEEAYHLKKEVQVGGATADDDEQRYLNKTATATATGTGGGGGGRGILMTRLEVGLRMMTLGLTLAAAMVVGVNKETKMLSLTVSPTLPILRLPVTAKWNYVSSSVYFVVANSIVCLYAVVVSFVHYGITTKTLSSNAALLMNVADVAMVALLFSANGASTSIGVIAKYGNSHVRWKKVCHVFSSYCNHMMVALALSMLASLIFLWIVVSNIIKLHKKNKNGS